MTEGAYSAHLSFVNGVFASLTYSGYGHFDTDALQGWTGELGQRRDPEAYGDARRALRGVADAQGEAALKEKRAYGVGSTPAEALRVAAPPHAHNHFGLVIVSCERGDLRPMPDRIEVFADDARRVEMLPAPLVPRGEVIDELASAVLDGEAPLHTGEWGMATTEVMLALHASAVSGREMPLHHQIGLQAPVRA